MGSLYTGDKDFPSFELKNFRPAKVVHNLSAFRIGDTIVFKDKKGNHYEARAMSRGNRSWALNAGWQLPFLKCLIDLGSVTQEAYDRIVKRIDERQIDQEMKWAERDLADAKKKIKELKAKKKSIKN